MPNNITEYEQELGPRWTGWRDRYWSHLDTSDPNSCWIWKSNNKAARYPQFKVGSKKAGRMFYTHRIAYELAYGPIPPGQGVLHSCDEPWCCNPKHLRTGSQADNMRDAIDRDRIAKGNDNGRRKLTEADVREIRSRYSVGTKQQDLAKIYQVSQSAIQSVVTRRTWRHIT